MDVKLGSGKGFTSWFAFFVVGAGAEGLNGPSRSLGCLVCCHKRFRVGGIRRVREERRRTMREMVDGPSTAESATAAAVSHGLYHLSSWYLSCVC